MHKHLEHKLFFGSTAATHTAKPPNDPKENKTASAAATALEKDMFGSMVLSTRRSEVLKINAQHRRPPFSLAPSTTSTETHRESDATGCQRCVRKLLLEGDYNGW